jgi:hypothetical protein
MGSPDDCESRASSVAVPVDIVGVEAGLMPGGSLSALGRRSCSTCDTLDGAYRLKDMVRPLSFDGDRQIKSGDRRQNKYL